MIIKIIGYFNEELKVFDLIIIKYNKNYRLSIICILVNICLVYDLIVYL